MQTSASSSESCQCTCLGHGSACRPAASSTSCNDTCKQGASAVSVPDTERFFCHRPGMLVQFSIGLGGVHLVDGELISADLTAIGLANQRRGHADISSKVCAPCKSAHRKETCRLRHCNLSLFCLQIVFQHMARHQPLTMDMLLASLSSTGTGEAPVFMMLP